MAKSKLRKYERVKHLPNVTMPAYGESREAHTYPWNQTRYTGLKKVLELGCGKGEHSLEFAAADQGKLCVGVDRKSHRICVGAEKALARDLQNILFLRARIEQIGLYFVERSISEIWLPFPDPHVKARAAKDRLTAPPFLDAYAKLLKPGGLVHLKTDSDLLYHFSVDAIQRWGGRAVAASEDIHGENPASMGAPEIGSAFETAARSEGRAIKYLAFALEK